MVSFFIDFTDLSVFRLLSHHIRFSGNLKALERFAVPWEMRTHRLQKMSLGAKIERHFYRFGSKKHTLYLSNVSFLLAKKMTNGIFSLRHLCHFLFCQRFLQFRKFVSQFIREFVFVDRIVLFDVSGFLNPLFTVNC